MTAAVEIPNGGPCYNPGMGTYSMSPEIDVYRDPHLRMKEVIQSTIDQMKSVDIFSLDDILQSVYISMWELKSHEFIENTFIMDRLRARLSSQKVYNKQVCNCHEDSSLVSIITLVEQVYAADNDSDRLHKLLLLQAEVSECLTEMMPHMEEEENVFQPLLTEYFDYEELREIKEKVVEQHKLWKEKLESEKTLRKVQDVENEERLYFEMEVLEKGDSEYCKKLAELDQLAPVNKLPEELVVAMFMFLSPKELAIVAKVSKMWNIISKDKSLWRTLLPSQWARGHWSFQQIELLDRDIGKMVQERNSQIGDEDYATEVANVSVKMFSGLVQHLLPKVGEGVKKLVVSGNSTISSQQLRKMIKLCPNLEELDCSYTNIGDSAFKGISNEGSFSQLKKLDLTGCVHISNISVERISSCFIPSQESKPPKVSWISVSGCKLLTDKIFGYIEVFKGSLKFIDMSGCSRISGERMKFFAKKCSLLLPENLAYCDLIEDGPYEDQASGCQNVDCPLRECCMKQRN